MRGHTAKHMKDNRLAARCEALCGQDVDANTINADHIYVHYICIAARPQLIVRQAVVLRPELCGMMVTANTATLLHYIVVSQINHICVSKT